MKTQKESLGKTFRRKARRFFGIKKNAKENYIELNIKAHGHGKAREFPFTIQRGGGITGHLLFTPVMTHKSEVSRFYIFKINIVAVLVYLIIFCLFLLFKT